MDTLRGRFVFLAGLTFLLTGFTTAVWGQVPLINQPLVPTSAAPGGPGFTLTVNGTGFTPQSIVEWDGVALFTLVVSSEQLTASVPASYIATVGTASVTVVNPGAPASYPAFFLIANSAPTVDFVLSAPTSVGYTLALVTGDFNNDGIPDLAVSQSDFIYVMLGNGDGTFGAPISTYAQNRDGYSGNLVPGDFNGDGKLDLIFGGPYGFQVFLGNGNGTLSPGATYTAGNGNTSYSALFTGDFNGDGKLDFGIIGVYGGLIYLGNGDGTFQSEAIAVSGSGATVGDFNGDGILDLAVPDGSSNLQIQLGNGDGSFQPPVDYPLPGASAAVTADFNGDGKLDVAVTAPSNSTVAILLGNGDGTFQAGASYATNVDPIALTVGDFNNDGKPDLAVVDLNPNGYGGFVSILLNNGDGTFQTHIDYGIAPEPQNIVAADFANDGELDLAFSLRTSNVNSVELLEQGGLYVTPSSLDYGDQALGTTSAPQTVTINNTANSPLPITSIMFSGADPQDFAQTNTCGTSDPPQSTCTISVTFAPTATGTLTASLNVNDGAPGSPQTVSLTGTGLLLAVAISPASVTFPTQLVNTTSAAQDITVTNTGNGTLDFSSIVPAGNFTEQNTCGTSLAPGAACAIIVQFNPQAVGTQTGSIMITDNVPGSPQSVPLSGTGTVVVFSPIGVYFGTEPLRTTSPPVMVTLTNTGTTALNITSIGISGSDPGDFAQTNNCGSSVAAGGSCTIMVTFTPTLSKAYTADISVGDDGGGSPQTVSLAGAGFSALAGSPTGTVDFFGDGKGDLGVWRPATGTWYILSNSGGSNLTEVWGAPGDVPVPGDYDGDGKDDFAVWRPSSGTWYIIPSSDPNSPITTAWGLPGDVPMPADYDGDGITDIAQWRPSNATYYVILSSTGKSVTQQWGSAGDVPVSGDFDGDGKADYAIFRPSTGTWYYIASRTGKTVTTTLGQPGDIPVEGDYDGDGKMDLALWRASSATFYVLQSSTGNTVNQQWGLLGDIPVIGDYDGDGKNDYAVWRPSNGTWYILQSSNGQTVNAQWGLTGDVPASRLASIFRRDKHIANYDGDRKADVGVWRPSNGVYYVIDSTSGKSVSEQWGEDGDLIVPGDYDGDGRTDYAIWRPSNGTWYVLYSSTGKTVSRQWGKSGDVPAPGDYDGDGKTDYAVWRPSTGTWYVIASSTGKTVTEQWGENGDIPVPADYDGDGKTDYAVWESSYGDWCYLASSAGQQVCQKWGEYGDIPVPGDYDGDTKADFTVFRPSTGTWHTIASSTGETIMTVFGENGDIPVAKDYDGDEKADIAVWRPSNGTWYILQSSTGKTVTTRWGLTTDVPVNKPTGQ